ncbi:gamma-glutamyl-gamma-aminobutyrate hydrolase family protein [Gulosibacter chungangensis]|uniref:Gamma-glutamyl-gamma-aminobutyrate hydrolase family protein n=1 Tax=Gulosibacter chungangensis TaxID=979746 RepID=A0A7J5BBR7_9MICO|nr:gamma-glutamyl-gamma-aminobutyrate hydrolase family protein [Gulosibacter chungangensis]KAB1643564.1 gamma-glutamyl-gamma-aminobutyrate hydrolase family protein [Gulosibacter chungangensis]
MSAQVPFLLVVDGTNERADQTFTNVLDTLTQQVVAVARTVGWLPNRLYIGDVSEEAVREAYSRADAVVIMGGEDVTPELYGRGVDYPESGNHLRVADERTTELVRESVANGKPVFGICRGLQLMNVALGGTLIQHLETADAHRKTGREEHEFVKHPVSLIEGSKLREILEQPEIDTESSHHQAVDALGQNLRIAAVAPDGTVEAIEHETAPVLAVQWHPESLGSDPGQLETLLRGLLEYLRAYNQSAIPAAEAPTAL